MTRSSILLLIATVFALETSLWAEITSREAQRFCVDIVVLKGGGELRGSVLKRDTQEIQIAVQRNWLTTRQPKMAEQVAKSASQDREKSQQLLKERITKWRQERSDMKRLTFVLDRELERLADPKDLDTEESQFVIVQLPAEQVRRVFEASAASRSLATAAWFERLEKVEETVLGKLKTQVEATHPQWATERIDISDRLPQGPPQNDDEWAARQALWEYEFCESLDYQGTGNFVMRVEPGKKLELSSLLGQSGESLLAGQLGDLGLDLGAGQPAAPKADDWQKRVIAEAKELGMRGFLVTRSPQITGEGPATVTAQFFARLPGGQYQAIWTDTVQTDPATIPEADLKRIESDPQIQEVLKVAQAFQLGNQIQTAVRFGGAVEVSLKSVAANFGEFRSRYTRTLDGPPLPIKTQTP